MKAVILAAGEGKRLRPFTFSEPKVMIPVANRSLMDYVVRALVSNKVTDILIVVGYRKERIMTYFGDGDGFGADITYVNQDKQLGNGHALFAAKDHLDEDFIVLPGDSLVDAVALSHIIGTDDGYSALVVEGEIPAKYGIAVLDRNRVIAVSDRAGEGVGSLALTGAYRLPIGFLETLAQLVEAGDYNLSHAVNLHLRKMKLEPVFCRGLWIDAVYPWDLLEVNHAALATSQLQTAGKVEKNVLLQGRISIGEGSVIRSGTTIYGPVAIGSGCDIGPNVSIFPSTSIGDNVTVEPFTVIRNSLVMSDCEIGPHSLISQGVIGYGVHIRSHLMAPAADAYVRLEDEFYKVPNIGTLVGEDCMFGSGVSVEPGTVIGPKSRIMSGSRVDRNLPTGAIHS